MRDVIAMLCLGLSIASPAVAAAPGNDAATAGVKAALELGADKALAVLGRQDGYLGDPDVRIPLPGKLQKGRKLLDKLGMKKQTAALELTINRVAEMALPQARQLIIDAIGRASPEDAVAIVNGPQDAATRYFRNTMAAPLATAFQPIVAKVAADLQLSRTYDAVAAKAREAGLTDQDSSLDAYVTHKALDGLFLMMTREEAAIREDPSGQANPLLGEVFGGHR
ncbi:MAG TPA: DUF4197 domain-containing protein [Steroidobacteraceae bacterium]|nr:DUF4197 domain-containing protein [Steroidobacteraceae bacterium]